MTTDLTVEKILLAVIANGFISLAKHVASKGEEILIGKELLEKWKLDETALQPVLKEAVDELAESIEWTGPSRMEQVVLFLRSPEVEAMVRQLYSAKLSDSQSSLELIRAEFLASFSLYTQLEGDKITEAAGNLFNSILGGCEKFLGIAIDEGIVAAHEAKSGLRQRIVLGEQ